MVGPTCLMGVLMSDGGRKLPDVSASHVSQNRECVQLPADGFDASTLGLLSSHVHFNQMDVRLDRNLPLTISGNTVNGCRVCVCVYSV